MKRLGVFLLFFLLPVLTVGAVLAWSPLLKVRRIDVTGQMRCTTEEILAASGLAHGDHPILPIIWTRAQWPQSHLEEVRRSVEKLPWVASARVDWIPLHEVRIRVTERTPFARIPHLGGYLLLDRSGVVLEKQDGEPDPSLKELRGVMFSGYANGHRPQMESPVRLDTGLRVLDALWRHEGEGDRNLHDVVSWVDVLAVDRVLISLEDRIAVRLDPTGDLQYMLDFTAEIFFRHIRPEEKGMLDFTRGEDPSFIPD